MTELSWEVFDKWPGGTVAQSVVEPWWLRTWQFNDIIYTMLYEQQPPLGDSRDGPTFNSLIEAQEYL